MGRGKGMDSEWPDYDECYDTDYYKQPPTPREMAKKIRLIAYLKAKTAFEKEINPYKKAALAKKLPELYRDYERM